MVYGLVFCEFAEAGELFFFGELADEQGERIGDGLSVCG